MQDEVRTREQLVAELHELRARVAELESERSDLNSPVAPPRESEEIYRQLAENINEVFWVADADVLRIIYISPAYEKVWGQPRESLYADPRLWTESIHPEDRRRVPDAVSFMGTDGHIIEYRIIRPDGAVRWVLDRRFPVRNASGQIYRVAGIVEDITERKKSEEALREREEIYRAIVDQAAEGIALIDARTLRFVEFNDAICTALGYSREEFARLTLVDLEGRRTLREVKEGVQKIIEEGSSIFEHQQRLKDGTLRDVLVSNRAIRLRGREYLVGISQDLTDIKRKEEALRENEEKYRRLFENDLVAICIYDFQTLRFLDVNDAHVKLYDYSREELMGGMIATDVTLEHDASVRSIEEIRCSGTMYVPLRYHRKKDGTVFPVEIVGGSHILKGRRVIFSMIRDIGDRMRAETAMEQANSLLRNTMNAIQDLVTVHDRNLRVVLSNWQGRDHISREERESFPHCYACYMRRDKPCEPCPTMEVFRTGRSARAEIKNPYTQRITEVTAYPVVDASGKFDLVTEHVRDITDLKKAEREREELQVQFNQARKMESVGRLAGGVAHDFNNMLGVIIGHAEMALQEIDPAQSVYSDLKEILTAANRSANLVRQLLAFARKQTINPQILDINETVESMLKMLCRLIGENIELQWNPGSDIWPVRMDPTQIDQILANLCVNARDAIAGCGKVSIETAKVSIDGCFCAEHAGATPDDYVLLCVSDNGCGMEKEILDNLFEPFFTTKEVGKGTGLGLATVYGIVKQNGGYINAESEPGRGTKFFIYLPGVDVPKPEDRLPEQPEVIRKGTETILFVEDENAILNLGKKILERYGYRVLTANSPAVALELAANYPGQIDLLITDVIMPGMNGKELAEILGALKGGFRSIYISGYAGDVLDRHDVVEGVNFLQKPFSVNSLIEKVREVLEADTGHAQP